MLLNELSLRDSGRLLAWLQTGQEESPPLSWQKRFMTKASFSLQYCEWMPMFYANLNLNGPGPRFFVSCLKHVLLGWQRPKQHQHKLRSANLARTHVMEKRGKNVFISCELGHIDSWAEMERKIWLEEDRKFSQCKNSIIMTFVLLSYFVFHRRK